MDIEKTAVSVILHQDNQCTYSVMCSSYTKLITMLLSLILDKTRLDQYKLR